MQCDVRTKEAAQKTQQRGEQEEMNPIIADIINTHFPGVGQRDHFGNDIERMKRDAYGWTIETLTDCMHGLDARSLQELVDMCKLDPDYIMGAAIKQMETELRQRIASDHLCPECLTEMQVQIRICTSDGWNEPAGSWEEACGVEVCPQCGYEK